MLHCMVIFSVLLKCAVNVRAQCERPVVGGNRILTEVTDKPPFNDGSTVKFKCALGYVPVNPSASRIITCTGSQWSDLGLQCKKRPCGSPELIVNGRYRFQDEDGIAFGATITAVCDPGYQLIGQMTRNCRHNGWDGRAPTCEVVKCEPPPRISYGTYEPQDNVYEYSHAVSYSCDRGRTLIGPSDIMCSGDGTFQPPPPQCLYVSCDKPDISNAIRIEGKPAPYGYGNFVRYKCNIGYRMEGSDSLTCKENGWDPPPPNCSVVTCSKPPGINNGQFTPLEESYKYGDIVTYSCNQGFGLTGTLTISCTDEGTFETPFHRCLIECPKPPAINNGQFTPLKESYLDGDRVTYSCFSQRFELIGPPTISCTDKGTFETPIPHCQVTCDEPTIKHGIIIEGKSKSYKYKSWVRVQCNEGYTMNGSDYLTCEEEGWNPRLSQCNLEVTCDEPTIKHGIIIEGKSKSYKYKSWVRVQCNEGYTMDGSDYLTCEEEGWTPRHPQCNSVAPSSSTFVIIGILVVLLVIAVVAVLCWLKKRKCKEHKAPSNPEDCSLVNMSIRAPEEKDTPSQYTPGSSI